MHYRGRSKKQPISGTRWSVSYIQDKNSQTLSLSPKSMTLQILKFASLCLYWQPITGKGDGYWKWRSSRHTPPMSSVRSEEHTSELQSLMRISYAVFCLKKTKHNNTQPRSQSTDSK